jgi:Putative zinc-finger
MCNKDDLVSYLYDDLDEPARTAFERHLRGCADCRDDLTAMRGVRADLLTWSPPEPDFAFRIVAEPRAIQAAVLRPAVPSWRAWITPAAGLAAAAVLVLAAAAGLARVEVHKGSDGWTLRTGASISSGETAFAGFGGLRGHDVHLSAPAGEGDPMTALERRVAALETASHDTANARYASVQSARASNEEIMKVVRELLSQSEGRQKNELALRVAQVLRDVDAQRVADLNRMQQGLGRIDASVATEAEAHRELMTYILTKDSKQK